MPIIRNVSQSDPYLASVRKIRGAVRAVNTAEERRRIALMAAWTRRHGHDPGRNPYSRENYTTGEGWE